MDFRRISETISANRPTLQGAKSEYAVLVPLIPQQDGYRLLYEVRASSLHHQPNEVCFPGGRIEAGESPVDCALRETQEELGLSRDALRLIGPLDFLLRGGSIIYPVLAELSPDSAAAIRTNPAEVASVFTVPLTWLRDHPPEIYRETLRPQMRDFPYAAVQASPDYPWLPLEMEVPVYRGLPHPLWGMTARITAHLIQAVYEKKDR